MSKNKLGDLLNSNSPFNQGGSLAQNLLAQVGNARGLSGALSVSIEMVVANEKQVRRSYDQEALQELAEDIRQRGILEPLIVRINQKQKYEIVGGWRRYMAAQLVGLTELPVIVHEMTDREAELVNLAENIQREDLSPVDEQRFFRYLQDTYNLSNLDIGKLINKSDAYVRRRLQGQLAGFQQPNNENNQTSSDSDINNKLDASSFLLNNSQYTEEIARPSKNLKPGQLKTSSFTRFIKTLNETLTSVEEQSPDNKTRQSLLARLDEIDSYVSELRQKLTVPSKKNPK